MKLIILTLSTMVWELADTTVPTIEPAFSCSAGGVTV
jgi:hypothetical protein